MSDSPNPESPNDPTPPTDAGSARPPVDTRAASQPPPPPPPGYLPPAYPAPPKQRGVLAKVGTSLVASLLIISLVLNVYLGFIVYSVTAGPREAPYRGGDAGGSRVVIVPIEGGIDDAMVQFVRGAFKALDQDPPAAVVLRVNSGGGGVTPSDQIWNLITRFRSDHPDVKMVASFGGIAASGGYYVATPADYIVCEQTGITGSIGVIAQFPTLETLAHKLGVDVNTIVADGSPQKAVANNLFEDWRNDQGELTETGEESRQVIENLLNSAYERFVEVVAGGRKNLTNEQVREIASGHVYTADEAVDVGLVDEKGYLDNAVDKAIEMAGLDAEAPVTTLGRRDGFGLLGLLGADARPPAAAASLTRLDPAAVRTWLADVLQVELAYRVNFR